jgi:hypothetical protein
MLSVRLSCCPAHAAPLQWLITNSGSTRDNKDDPQFHINCDEKQIEFLTPNPQEAQHRKMNYKHLSIF